MVDLHTVVITLRHIAMIAQYITQSFCPACSYLWKNKEILKSQKRINQG